MKLTHRLLFSITLLSITITTPCLANSNSENSSSDKTIELTTEIQSVQNNQDALSEALGDLLPENAEGEFLVSGANGDRSHFINKNTIPFVSKEPHNREEAEQAIENLLSILENDSLKLQTHDRITLLHRIADLYVRFLGERKQSLKFLEKAEKISQNSIPGIRHQITLTRSFLAIRQQVIGYARKVKALSAKIRKVSWWHFIKKSVLYLKLAVAKTQLKSSLRDYYTARKQLKESSFYYYKQTLHREEAPKTIRLSSFNIRLFSDNSRTDDELNQIARVIKDYDIIAIQEVKDTSIIPRFVAFLKTHGRDFGYVISPPVGKNRNKEYYTFIYDKTLIKCTSEGMVHDDVDDEFIREPFFAKFRSGNFDFALITIHILWGKSINNRRVEIARLASMFAEVQLRLPGEKDLILLGDFNMRPSDKSWAGFKAVPGMKFLIDEPKKSVISDKDLYDNLWVRQPDIKEYTGTSGVFPYDEIIYDNDDNRAKLAVSDHRPVWAEFRIDMSDDD